MCIVPLSQHKILENILKSPTNAKVCIMKLNAKFNAEKRILAVGFVIVGTFIYLD